MTLPFSDAYKHVKIRLADIDLQWIRIGGRYLVDSALTFGSSSSPGIFDRVAEIILRLALHIAKLSRDVVIRQLDDNVFIGENSEVWKGYNTFNKLAQDIGVRVSPEEKGKAFPPQDHGAILGFNFNIRDWCWSMDEDKATKILRLLYLITEDGAICHEDLDTLVGKIGFYWPLFDGRFERTMLFSAQNVAALKKDPVLVTPQLQSQARWWIISIRAAMEAPLSLPDPRSPFPAHQVSLFPDAAGGVGPAGSGFGAVVWLEDTQHWAAHFWPEAIRGNMEIQPGGNCDPQRLGYHTMVLEAAAALANLLVCPERIKNLSLIHI